MFSMENESAAHAVLCLPGRPDQVGRARRWISKLLGAGHPLHDDCVLLTSELATNAVVHSNTREGGVFTLEVWHTDRWLRVRVRDGGSATPPCACHAVPDASGGRGMPMLDTLARRWGLSREAGVNEVWFELAKASVNGSTRRNGPQEPRVTVG